MWFITRKNVRQTVFFMYNQVWENGVSSFGINQTVVSLHEFLRTIQTLQKCHSDRKVEKCWGRLIADMPLEQPLIISLK